MRKEHVYYHHGINILRSSDPRVRRVRRQQHEPRAHGNKVWRSSLVLMDYLSDNPPRPKTQTLEVGCGWGAVSVLLAKQCQASVTALDIDSFAGAMVALHGQINHCKVNFLHRDFTTLDQPTLGNFQLIVGADICFWDHLVDPIIQMISSALSAGSQRLLIADPGRPPFWLIADHCVENFGAEILSRTIYTPCKTQKYILRIDNA